MGEGTVCGLGVARGVEMQQVLHTGRPASGWYVFRCPSLLLGYVVFLLIGSTEARARVGGGDRIN